MDELQNLAEVYQATFGVPLVRAHPGLFAAYKIVRDRLYFGGTGSDEIREFRAHSKPDPNRGPFRDWRFLEPKIVLDALFAETAAWLRTPRYRPTSEGG